MSSTSTSASPSTATPHDSRSLGGRIESGGPQDARRIEDPQHVPCYNRETIFDEEWQAHMKNVHGVFLIWPETWMRRIEVLDLDAFGGDISVCNDVVMDN